MLETISNCTSRTSGEVQAAREMCLKKLEMEDVKPSTSARADLALTLANNAVFSTHRASMVREAYAGKQEECPSVVSLQ